MSTNHYTFENGTLQFIHGFNEPLEPYYDIMVYASRIIFPNNFDQPIMLFPNTTYLKVERGYNLPIVLSQNLWSLHIFTSYGHVLKLPSGLKTLIIFKYELPLELNKNMKIFEINNGFNRTIRLNKIMEHITIQCYNNQIILNKKLNCFHVWGTLNQLLELPKHLTRLSVAGVKKILLPPFITYLNIGCVNTDYFVLEYKITKPIHIIINSCDPHLLDNIPNNKEGILLNCGLKKPTHNLPNNSVVKGHFYK